MIPGNYTLRVVHRAFSSRVEFLNDNKEQIFVATIDNKKKDYMSFWHPVEKLSTALKLESTFMNRAFCMIEELKDAPAGTECSIEVELKEV